MRNIQRFSSLRQVLWAWVAILAVTSSPAALVAQSPTRSPQPVEPIGAIVGGALGASIGIVGGAFMGYAFACGGNSCTGDFEGFGAAVLGIVVGEALLLPLGVHIGNGSAGNLAKDVGVSLGVGAATILLGAENSSILTLGLLAQFGLTVWAERAAGARATREVMIEPRGFANGRTGVGLSIRY